MPGADGPAVIHRGVPRWFGAALCLLLAFIALPAALAQDAGRYLGVASCAGATCHGRAEGNGAVVRQDEIATWQAPSSATGAHSRALAVLNGMRARRPLVSPRGPGPKLGRPSAHDLRLWQ